MVTRTDLPVSRFKAITDLSDGAKGRKYSRFRGRGKGEGQSASRAFPLVTIQREQIDRNVCSIGRVLGVKRGRLSLLQINPHATWDEKPTEYRLSEITRVNFGGDYENALYLVGGNPSRT
jgi:hypothetical protein